MPSSRWDSRRAQSGGGRGRRTALGRAGSRPLLPELALHLLIELDRPNGVLVGKLRQHLVDDADHVGLLVSEVVQQGVQRAVGDLELRRGQLQVIVELGGWALGVSVVAHELPFAAGASRPWYGRDRLAAQRAPLLPIPRLVG